MEKKRLFASKINMPLIAQYVRVYLANQRQGTASTKDRGEVSGGGKKPWRQKGTGRARHGSIRSPIWVGGGVAHSPKPRDWSLKMPPKMRRQALLSALALCESKGAVYTFAVPALEKISTKEMSAFLTDKKIIGSSLLVLPDFKAESGKKVRLSGRNIKGVSTVTVAFLNAYIVMRAKNVVFLGGSEKKV
ncbi:MAG: 50S ribosomal protein L4 [bacterium]